jgi:CRP-like cAMP-binding protein
LSDLGAGDYFGEIGLIERIPRTATVTATTKAVLLRIDGAAFLDALTQSAPSAALLDGASLRLRRTHPSQNLTQSGLSSAS